MRFVRIDSSFSDSILKWAKQAKIGRSFVDNDSQKGLYPPLGRQMNLWDAPFKRILKVNGIESVSDEVRLVLIQLGLDIGEQIEKIHKAPLGDPVSLKIGNQVFSLRSEICRQISVGVLE